MIRKIGIAVLCLLMLGGCRRYERIDGGATAPAPVVVGRNSDEAEAETEEKVELTTAAAPEPETETEAPEPERIPVKVKGVYLSAYVAGTASMMDEIIQHIDETEVNAVVIDVKDDNGRITFAMDSPMVSEIGAVEAFIPDIDGLMKKLKDHGIYTIARVVAFRDPYLPEQKPELALKLADGSIYRDNKGLAWVNPYKQEAWDYLVEVGIEAHKAGFDEVQFDYIRFSTERGIGDVVYDEADTQGRSRTEIISQFVEYAYEKLAAEGVYVAADVFGAIIGGGVDSDNVGQSYGDMAASLDYICPMIYPSHYGDGNFGIDHPDTQPYDTILAALQGSKADLRRYQAEGARQAVVRPWLQDFTASYLEHYIEYGDEQVRQQIQAVYDAGYDEWLLWSAACRYHWDALLTPEEAEEEARQIAASRAAQPETEPETETEPAAETESAAETPAGSGDAQAPAESGAETGGTQ